MLSQSFYQRLKDLEDHITSDHKLLRDFEEALRYETNPRVMGGYRRDIERQQESLAKYRQEYAQLKQELAGTPNAQMQNVESQLQQMDAKLNVLLSGQYAIYENQKQIIKKRKEEIKPSSEPRKPISRKKFLYLALGGTGLVTVLLGSLAVNFFVDPDKNLAPRPHESPRKSKSPEKYKGKLGNSEDQVIDGDNNQVIDGDNNILNLTVLSPTNSKTDVKPSGISKTYLELLIARRCDLVEEAQKHLDIGTRPHLVQAHRVEVEGLREILHDLSILYYPQDKFQSQNVTEYYDERISLMRKAIPFSKMETNSYRAELAIETDPTIISDLILEIVDEVLPNKEFDKWKKKWDEPCIR